MFHPALALFWLLSREGFRRFLFFLPPANNCAQKTSQARTSIFKNSALISASVFGYACQFLQLSDGFPIALSPGLFALVIAPTANGNILPGENFPPPKVLHWGWFATTYPRPPCYSSLNTTLLLTCQSVSAFDQR